jgi:hypothetical protein
MSESTATSWYSVRCLFQWRGPGKKKRRVYEERITLWRAASFEEAIAKAEAEAIEYLADEDEPTRRPFRYLSLAQAYRMSEWDDPGEGIEVFSMLRESNKKPKDYLTRFFDTGNENNGPAL